MKKLLFLSICSTLSLTIAALFYWNIASAQTSVATPAKAAQGGVKETVLNVAAGRIRIYLPEDIRPGDTISGVVTAEPAGKTDAERARNSAELNGYVVEIAGARQNTWEQIGKKLQSTIKFALTSGTSPAGLVTSKAGNPVSNFNVPVSSLGITNPSTSPPTPENFKLPTIGQQGRPVEIQGPFDGSFDDTSVKVGGQPVEKLTESPRAATFRNPENVVGMTELEMKEGDVAKSAPFRNLKLDLTAPKTNLMKGESTVVKVTVSGLEGLTTPVPVQIVTTGTVNLSGGNIQNIPILPNNINPEGIFTQTFNLTATQAGGFSVTANVLGEPEQEQKKCECKCQLNEKTPVNSGGKSGGTYSFTPNLKTKKCTGDKCSLKNITYAWTVSETATNTVREGTNTAEKLIVDVTGDGSLTISVTVTITCSDGSTCTDRGFKEFNVKK